jgi:hypothetical protein
VDASGILHWGALGIAICTATGDQQFPTIVSDGAGGAVVTWQDNRGSSADIYAQRVNSMASLQWTTSGVPLCTATGDQYSPVIASDGANGAIVAWYDIRSWDIYAQRVNGSGAVQWTTNGVVLCAATGNQQYPTIAADGAGGAVVAWYDSRSGTNDIYAQAVDARGQAGLLAPTIYSVKDVPGDQGGQLYLSWYGTRSDIFMDGQVSYYSIWRAIKPTKATLALENGASSIDDLSKLDRSSGKGVIRVEKASNGTFFWELMGTMDALYMPAYGDAVPTLFDSTSICKEYTYLQVIAHTSVPTVFWASAPDSGYSVDNFAPGVPKALAGKQSSAPAGLDLTWERNREPDLDVYHVYRGLTAGFVPGPGSLISSPKDTTLLDTGWRWNAGYYYKVSAVDVHGNESGFALLAPDAVTGTETPKAPAASYLAQNYPNPFNPITRIAFGLSAPAHVSLRIYDAAGRLVRALVNEDRQAGRYEEAWNGRDSSDHTVASGIYFYRLDAGAFETTKKMILVR